MDSLSHIDKNLYFPFQISHLKDKIYLKIYMQSNQPKEIKHSQSFQKFQESPNLTRVNANSTLTQQQLQVVSGRNKITQIAESRTLSPPPHSLIFRDVSIGSQNNTGTEKARLFYSQAYGHPEQGSTVFYNQISPGQINKKSIGQLEYQNSVLLQQLYERDEVIALFKSGWQPSNIPINDELVKNLNLHLAKKNNLIEQFHRSLAQFEETVRRENLKLSPICIQQFQNLKCLIVRHQQYPILITQRLIQTSKKAETIYIKDKTVVQEYYLKLEQSYKQVTILREKISWFQRQNSKLEGVIANMKSQIDQFQNIQKQETSVYQQQINVYKTEINQFHQQVNVYQQEIHNLKIVIQQLQSNHNNQYLNQITLLKQQVSNYQAQINSSKQQIGALQNEINAQKQQLIVFQNQNNSLRKYEVDSKQKINSFSSEINGYKQQIGKYNAEIANLRNQIISIKQQSNVYITEINNYKQQINVTLVQSNNYKQQVQGLQNEIAGLKQQLRQSQGSISSQMTNYKQQINIYVTQINNFKQQINVYNTQISSLKQQIQSIQLQNNNLKIQIRDNQGGSNEANYLKQQINGYANEINNYKKQIHRLEDEINRLRNQMKDSSKGGAEIQTYRLQINSLTTQISTYQQKITLYISQINSYKQQILMLQGEIENLKRQNTKNLEALNDQISKYKQQISSLSLTIQQESTKHTKQVQWLKGQLEKAKSSSGSYINTNSSIRQVGQLRQQIDQYLEQIFSLKRKIQSYQSKQFDTQWELDTLKRENERLKNENSKFRQEINSLQEQTNRLNQQISKLRGKNSSLQNQLNIIQFEWKSKYEQSQSVIRRLQREIQQISYRPVEDDWKIKFQTLEYSYRGLSQTLEKYKAQIQDLEDGSRYKNNQANIIQIREQIRLEIFQQIREQLRFQLITEIEQKLRVELYREIEHRLRIELYSQIEEKIKNQLYIEIEQRLKIQLYSQIEKVLRIQLYSEIEKQVKIQNQKQMLYKIELMEERLRKQIRQELSISVQLEVGQKSRKYWQLKISQYEEKIRESDENLRQAEQYIEHLMKKIDQLSHEIDEIKKLGIQSSPDFSQFQSKVQELQEENRINRIQLEQKQRELHEAETYILQIQQQYRILQQSKKDEIDPSGLQRLNQTIQELTIQIKEYLAQISQLQGRNQDLQTNYISIQEQYTSARQQYELIISRLNQEIILLKKQIYQKSNGQNEWDQEKKELIQRYERELKQRWDQLQLAEQHIATYTRQSQFIISQLERKVEELETEVDKLASIKINDQYLYKLDARYEEIKNRLMSISTQSTNSIRTEAEFWEAYQSKRKRQTELIQSKIQESLAIMSRIDQTIIVKRNQLYRLDLNKFEGILREIDQLKAEETFSVNSSSSREQFEAKFFQMLKSVATQVPQN